MHRRSTACLAAGEGLFAYSSLIRGRLACRRTGTAAAVGTDSDTLQRPHIVRRLPGAFGTARHAHDACGTVGLLDPLSAIECFTGFVANGIDLAGRHGRIGEQLFADEALQQLFLAR